MSAEQAAREACRHVLLYGATREPVLLSAVMSVAPGYDEGTARAGLVVALSKGWLRFSPTRGRRKGKKPRTFYVIGDHWWGEFTPDPDKALSVQERCAIFSAALLDAGLTQEDVDAKGLTDVAHAVPERLPGKSPA